MARFVHVGLAVVGAATLVAAACSAGKNENGDATSSSSSSSSGGSGAGTSTESGGAGGTTVAAGGLGGGPTSVGIGGSGGGTGGDMGCAQFTAEAQLEEAAMMVALDMSASMNGTKWNASQLAIVSSMDKDVFDSMSLGLLTYPAQQTDPPQCLCDYLLGAGTTIPECKSYLPIFGIPATVSCGVSILPQIPMALAGANKSNDATGVRRAIYDYLTTHSPNVNDPFDGSPVYDAMAGAYDVLANLSGVDERILLLITDGGFSCTSVTGRAGYSDGACEDWEIPDTVNALIAQHYNDATHPIRTFIVGVPGSDSVGQEIGGYATPPYNMRLALSTYAVSGSPDTLDPACESGLVFEPDPPNGTGGVDPTTPCHIDLTTGTFDANALADVIANVRGDALGCVYPLPEPPMGETIDLTKVNVDVTLDDDPTVTIPARSDPADDCAVAACWDYNLAGEVEILGKGCDDISAADSAKVEIVVGCETIIN